MVHKRGARKLALDVLYESEIKEVPAEEVLQRYEKNPGYEYASQLVRGVVFNKGEIDDIITRQAKDWSLERMAPVDLNLMRIAVFEILHMPAVARAVAINEAVEMAKIYSSDDASRFINGILGQIKPTSSN